MWEENVYLREEKITITRFQNHYEVFDYETFTTYIFDGYNGYDKYRLTKIVDKAGFTTKLHVSGDRLLMIEDSAGRKNKSLCQ